MGSRPLAGLLVLLVALLLHAPLSLGARTRRSLRAGAATRTTLRAAAGVDFNGVLDGMSWPAPPSLNDNSAAPNPTDHQKEREGVRQRMILAQGTTVTIWGPEALTNEQLADQARTVQHMTRHASCHGMCTCFCVMKPGDAKPDTTGAISSREPKFTSDCFCKDKAGALLAKPLESKAVDFYGTPLPSGSAISDIVRYPVPTTQYNVENDDLVLCLDAGDKRSYDPNTPSQWTDVSGNGPTTENVGESTPPLYGYVNGFVGFNNSEGGGALRFGAHGDRDVIVVQGLDVSPRKMPSLTVEVWVKLLSVPQSAGRVFGNSIDARARGGRSLFLHSIAYGPRAHDDVPPQASDPMYVANNARSGASAGHMYQSTLRPPTLYTWAQYVVVWTTDEVVMYKDGQEVSHESIFQDTGDVAMQGASHFAIGNDEHSHRGGPSKLDGLVALVRVWKRALDDEDVGRLYEHSEGRFHP